MDIVNQIILRNVRTLNCCNIRLIARPLTQSDGSTRHQLLVVFDNDLGAVHREAMDKLLPPEWHPKRQVRMPYSKIQRLNLKKSWLNQTPLSHVDSKLNSHGCVRIVGVEIQDAKVLRRTLAIEVTLPIYEDIIKKPVHRFRGFLDLRE